MKNKYVQIAITVTIFTTIMSIISPVVSIQSNAATKDVEEDFSTSATPKGKVLAATSSAAATAKASTKASDTATPKPVKQSSKNTVYKGEISATPSAVGKFNVTTSDGEKTIDTEKTTKVFILDKNQKTPSTVAKLKVGDKVIVIGNMSDDDKTLVAKFVMVIKTTTSETPHAAMYGVVTSREASGSAFILHIKGPTDDKDKPFTLNNDSVIKVKDLDAPKLSDVKIGDRVTLTYATDTLGINHITRIYVIPGRASGLLRDIRESSAAADKAEKDEKQLNAKVSPSASPSKTTTPSATASSATNH